MPADLLPAPVLPILNGLMTTIDVAARCGVTRATVGNWITVGVPLPNGQRVRLAALRLGSKWRIAPDALTAFVGRCTTGALPAEADWTETAGCPVPSKDAKRRLAAADAKLKALGL